MKSFEFGQFGRCFYSLMIEKNNSIAGPMKLEIFDCGLLQVND